MALALVLRLIAIDSRSLWTDEAVRVLAARQDSLFDSLRAAWAQPPSTPLYWVVLHWWVALFGHGDVAVRLFSVLPSVAAIPAIYALGRLLGGTATTRAAVGLLASLLLALSPLAVELGEEATMYAWTMLFATLAVWSGLSYLRDGRGKWRYVLFGAVLLYTHYMGTLLLAEMLFAGLIWLALNHDEGPSPVTRRNWVTVHLAMALAWTPWLIAMSIRLAQRWDELSHLQHRAGFPELHLLASYLSVSASASASWPPAATWLAISAGAGLALLAVTIQRGGWGFTRLLGALVVLFLLLLVGTSAATGAWIVQPRYLALVLPLALGVVTAGAIAAWHWVGSHRTLLRALAVVLLGGWLISQAGGVAAFYTNPVHGRDGVREIGAWLSADVRAGDLVLSNHQLLPWSVAQYYDGPIQALPDSRDVRDGYLLWPTPDVLDFAPSQVAALQPLLDRAQPQRVWLLYLPVMDPHELLMAKLTELYPQVTSRHFAYCDVYLFATTAK
jgi:4-amino-4-deoxy-L-arabinose transferase-like glycosyltransferase